MRVDIDYGHRGCWSVRVFRRIRIPPIDVVGKELTEMIYRKVADWGW